MATSKASRVVRPPSGGSLPLPPKSIRALHADLARWYASAARDLPWRRTRDPYAIWISEAMLQQTRVEVVIGYWQRFLARFPTLADLARASEDDVLALWSGLGYYSRARSLRAAARILVEQHGGRFPHTRVELEALPGIGPYTAGALLSIAFDEPEPLVDGNVARVFARLFGLEVPVGSSALTKRAWELARALVPARGDRDPNPGTWNQALMELGATVCTPKAPRCGACPLASPCDAKRTGRTEELPRIAARRPSVEVQLEVLLVRREDRVLLVRRPRGTRMSGMWELPTRELVNGDGKAHGLWPSEHAAGAWRAGERLGELTHTITHHRIRAAVHVAELDERARDGSAANALARTAASDKTADWSWAGQADLDSLALTGLTRKILRSQPDCFKAPGDRP